ncbi:hypothetical protein P22_1814 [Propionispora sp. 2/2-37]|uniref:GGDEF domain-containing protein n=1 Tax=Propionispora sp. 2/2-37 TaxID=1677858 RepID=UPI0006BB5E67|nr:diguanylate cyclase [Propionispora sp. 2/2-37]CUH95734.1 hypothetical protein P22_1814 [Propionispora sp. 2/2-37]
MRILIADDKEINRRILTDILHNMGYETQEASDGREALSILEKKHSPSIVLLDWEMPHMNGLEVCRMLRRRDTTGLNYKYIIMITGHQEAASIDTAFAAGADDYIAKPFNLQKLALRLRVAKRIAEMQQYLRRLATHDDLTAVLNRRTIVAQLNTLLTDSTCYPLALAILDIDRFQAINAALGHITGDRSLKEIARKITATLPDHSLFGRLGGEEFVIALPGTDAAGATKFCNMLRKQFSSDPLQISCHSIPVTVSIGLAVTLKKLSLDTLLCTAAGALATAKQQGRNRLVAMIAAEEQVKCLPS